MTSQRLGHRLDKAIDVARLVVDTEPETQAPVATVDVDAGRLESLVHVLGALDVEREEVAPGLPPGRNQGRDRPCSRS